MYRKSFKGEDQLSLELGSFSTPFASQLDPQNRWVKLSSLIPWERFEAEYSERFGEKGRQAYPFRMALGALLIQTKLSITDRELCAQISENPYLQFFLGMPGFSACPFDDSTVTHFRKRITPEMMNAVNEEIIRAALSKNGKGNGDSDSSSKEENSGKMILDATCVPEDIRHPTDLSLLDDVRKSTEEMVDCLWARTPPDSRVRKPRTHRIRARRVALSVLKKRKPRLQEIWKATRIQMNCVRRNLESIAVLSQSVPLSALGKRRYKKLLVSSEVLRQQRELYEKRRRKEPLSLPDRIVSLHKPHVRPIIRGKAGVPVEFGMKLSISVSEGFTHLDYQSFDPYHEGILLPEHVEGFKSRTGHYPEAVLVDGAYRTRDNRHYCKERGIRILGKPLGRPLLIPFIVEAERKQTLQDERERNAVESKFGIGKRRYGMARLMTRLAETSKTTAMLILTMLNLEKILRDLLSSLIFYLHWGFRRVMILSADDEGAAISLSIAA